MPVLLSLSSIALDSEGIAVVATDLSERKRHEEMLRRLNQELEQQVQRRTAELEHSQRLLQAVIETVPDPIYAKDVQSRLVLLNPAALKTVGKPADQVLGRDDREFYDDPAVGAAILENDRRVMASGVAEQFEEKLLTPEGYRDYVDTKAPWRDAQGKVIGIIGVSRDVTLRNQAEAALRQSEQRLKHAQQIANVGTWEWDIQTGALVWSEQVYRQMGEEPGAVNPTYDAFVRHIHPEDRAGFDAALQRALAGTAPFDLEVRMLRPDGTVRVLHTRGESLPGPDGRPRGMLGVSLDITERKQAEAALRDKEAELRAITEITPVMLTRCSRDLRYVYANRAYAAMLGCTPEQIVGRPIVEIMGEKGFATIRPRVEQVLQGQPAEYEDQVHFALTGKTRWLHATYVPERDEHGQVRGWVASIADITERKEAEEALRRIEQERKVAEAVQAERQRFEDVLNHLPAYVVLLSRDYQVPFANRFFEERFGKSGGRRCYEYLFNRGEPCEDCQTFTVFKTGVPHHWEWTGPDGRDYDIHDFPFTDVDGSSLVMEVGLDVTERKQAEAELSRHREHLQELVRERTAELHNKNEELTRFNNAMVGRELRMIELKQEINALCVQLGRPPAYPRHAGEAEAPPPAA